MKGMKNLSPFHQQLNGIEQSPQGYHSRLPLYQSCPSGPPHIAYPNQTPQYHKYVLETKCIMRFKSWEDSFHLF